MKGRWGLIHLAALLLLTVMVGGAYAYYSVSAGFENRFIMPEFEPDALEIQAVLAEPLWSGLDWEGNPLDPQPAVLGVELARKSMPGLSIPKNPCITVSKGGPVYLRYHIQILDRSDVVVTDVDLINRVLATIDEDTLATDLLENQPVLTAKGDIYYTVSTPFDNDETHTLFEALNIPASWKKAQVEERSCYTMRIVGQAVQSEGFDTAEAAFADADANATFHKKGGEH